MLLKKMNDTLSNTPGKRESMTVNGLITKEKTRETIILKIFMKLFKKLVGLQKKRFMLNINLKGLMEILSATNN